MNDERIRIPLCEAKHTSDNDSVIATRINMFSAALETRREIREDWYAIDTFSAIKLVELVLAVLCESANQFSLVCSQNVYSEVLRLREYNITL